MRVLLAGSLPATTKSLPAALRDAGASVLRCALDDVVASARIDEPDLVLLDPTAGRGASWRAVGVLRRAGLDLGIVLLAEADPAVEQIEAWLESADDCLLGLLDPREVIAHCRAIMRRRRGHMTSRLEVQSLVLDDTNGDVFFDGRSVRVPPRPKKLLRHLLVNADRVLPKERLITAMYGDDEEPLSVVKVVDVVVCHLRRALKAAGAPDGVIETVRGEGYIIRRQRVAEAPIGFQPSKARFGAGAVRGRPAQVHA